MITAAISPDRLWDFAAVCAVLGISRRHANRLVASHQLPALKLGKLTKFRASDIEKFIAGLPPRGGCALGLERQRGAGGQYAAAKK